MVSGRKKGQNAAVAFSQDTVTGATELPSYGATFGKMILWDKQ